MTLIERAQSRMSEALLVAFPDSLWFNGVEWDCIAPPLDIFKTINPQNYDAKVTFTFQMRKTDRAAAGIVLNSPIGFDTEYAAVFTPDATRLTFEVKHFNPDKNDTLVNIVCTLKQ